MIATFDQWLQASFDHPPTTEKQEDWYWDDGFDSFWAPLRITDAAAVRYMTRLFLESRCLSVYSLEQVAEGIWFLVGGSSPSRSSRALLNSAVSLRKRVACISAMSEFFRSFVAPATAGLAYEEADPFHSACFMWWHILALSPTHSETPEPDLQDACLTAMSEILALPSDVCRMSALHGLNHWQEHYGERVESTIDAFLAGRPEIAAPIREYAMIARSGQCL
ncbi:MAG: hypothetical protein WCC25_17065 [Candidatus Korobacteraceae bacterium]